MYFLLITNPIQQNNLWVGFFFKSIIQNFVSFRSELKATKLYQN